MPAYLSTTFKPATSTSAPRYQQVEIERCDGEEDTNTEGGQEESMNMSCYKSWESRLIGYSVSNQAQVVKIRSLARVGNHNRRG